MYLSFQLFLAVNNDFNTPKIFLASRRAHSTARVLCLDFEDSRKAPHCALVEQPRTICNTLLWLGIGVVDPFDSVHSETFATDRHSHVNFAWTIIGPVRRGAVNFSRRNIVGFL